MTLANCDFGYPMRLADWSALSSFTTVHPAVLDRINLFDVIRPAASVLVAFVVDMLSRGLVQRFVNEAVNLLQFATNSNVPVTIAISRSRPNPTVPIKKEASVKPLKRVVREHAQSIQILGFNATGAKHESAVGPADAPKS